MCFPVSSMKPRWISVAIMLSRVAAVPRPSDAPASWRSRSTRVARSVSSWTYRIRPGQIDQQARHGVERRRFGDFCVHPGPPAFTAKSDGELREVRRRVLPRVDGLVPVFGGDGREGVRPLHAAPAGRKRNRFFGAEALSAGLKDQPRLAAGPGREELQDVGAGDQLVEPLLVGRQVFPIGRASVWG